MTIAFWYRDLRSAASINRILSKGLSVTQDLDYAFQRWYSNQRIYRYHMINGSGYNMSQSTAFDLNAWVHVASTLEPKAGGGYTGKLYINGQLVGTRNTNHTNLNTSTQDLILGYWNNYYLKGRLDDVTIYHDNLNQSEIQELMANGPADLTDPTLKLYYSFDADTVDFQTNTVTDLSTHGNHGTISGGVNLVRWSDTQSGGQTETVDHALYFDGTGKVTVPHDASLQNNPEMTIAFWYRDLRSANSINRILSKGTTAGQDLEYALQRWYSNQRIYRYHVMDGNLHAINQSTAFDLNSWVHVASTLDYNAATNQYTGKLYINGQLKSTRTVSYNNLDTAAADLVLGYWNSKYLKGKLDDVAIYHDTLDQSEIQDLMANGPANLGDTKLKLYYSFDSDTVDFPNNTVTDLSTHGNDGTISGGVSLVIRNGQQIDYTYDFAGRRVSQTVNGVTTQFVYDGAEVIIDLDDSGTELKRYTYGPGIDEVLAIKKSSTRYYLTRDGLNSTTDVTDSAGTVVESYKYDVYGAVSIFDSSGNSIATSAVGNRYLYTGREWEPESGLYYYRARHYDPTIGRFLQPDPIGYADGLNLYQYVGGNPIHHLDPYGQFAAEAGAAIGIAAIDGPLPIGDVIAAGMLSYMLGYHLYNAVVGGSETTEPPCEEGSQAVDGEGNTIPESELTPTGETKTEPSTKKGNKEGESVQEGFKDKQGRDVTKHTVKDKNGNTIHGPHYRPGPIK